MKNKAATWRWIRRHFPQSSVRLAKDKVEAARKAFPRTMTNISPNFLQSDAFNNWVKLIRRSVKGTREEVDEILIAALERKFGDSRLIKLLTEQASERDSAKWLSLLQHHYVKTDVSLSKLLNSIINNSGTEVDEKSVAFVIEVGIAKGYDKDALFQLIKSSDDYVKLFGHLQGDVNKYLTEWQTLDDALEKIYKSNRPLNDLMTLFDNGFLMPALNLPNILNSYALSTKNVKLLWILAQPFQEVESKQVREEKEFAERVLKLIGQTWITHNYDVAKMLKRLFGNEEFWPELIDLPVSSAAVRAIVLAAPTESDGYKQAYSIFQNVFGKDELAKIIREINKEDEVGEIVKKFQEMKLAELKPAVAN